MRAVTYYRLSLLLPVVFPLLALVVRPLAGLGLILIVGMVYYGVGYGLFAVGALYWLSRPRDSTILPVAALVSPFFFAPLGALNATITVLIAGGRTVELVMTNLVFGAGASVAVGLCYAIPIAAVGALAFKGPRSPVLSNREDRYQSLPG